MIKRFIEAGEIVTTHGISGEVKVYPWCDSADFFKGFKTVYGDKNGRTEYRVQSVKTAKNMAVLKLESIDTPETARTMIGKVLYIDRNDAGLKKGRYFIQDIIGLEVKDAVTGRVYGKIVGVTHPAASDIYEIETPDNGTVLFPAVKEFLGEICPEDGYITVKPIKGMFDECELI